MSAALTVRTELPLPLYARGKVRDIYDLPGERLLLVATDRLSAFDHVLPTPIPDRGRVLTLLSAYWFERTPHLVANHFLSLEPPSDLPAEVGRTVLGLGGRAMVVRRAMRIDVECVVRGFLAGSAWEEYRRDGTVAGIALAPGLAAGDPLPEPIFTPAAKAQSGHDQNITFAQLCESIGDDMARRLRGLSVGLYQFGRGRAEAGDLVLADTKFEFGIAPDGELLLIDEVLTPDSSRYWDGAQYRSGLLAPFDKQYVRDYLTRSGWDREPPAPALPAEVVEATAERYREAFRRLTGVPLPAAPRADAGDLG